MGDGKKSKDLYLSSNKDRMKSSKHAYKHKHKFKHNNDLKDFLSATATIRKEATSRKEDKKSLSTLASAVATTMAAVTTVAGVAVADKDESTVKKFDETKDKKRRLSSNSELDDLVEPKPKQIKLKHDSDGEPEVKKVKTESKLTSMGRIPKLDKPSSSSSSEHRKDE